MRVGVIGAGISGLVCAKRLLDLAPKQQLQVTTLEWGRGPGGRMARRRVKVDTVTNNICESGKEQPQQQQGENSNQQEIVTKVEVSFDHAAPFFSARTRDFRDGLLAEWEATGFASRWMTATKSSISSEEENSGDHFYWVGVPSNNAIARGILDEIQTTAGGSCLFGQHVQAAKFDELEKVWNVRVADRNPTVPVRTYTFDALVMSDKLLLLPNTYAILDSADWNSLALPLDLRSTGAVVLLVAFHKPSVTMSATTAGVRHINPGEHPFLKTIIHDSAKPGREEGALDMWVVHSTHEYAASHLVGEQLDDADAVKKEMLDAFMAVLVEKEMKLPVAELASLLAHSSVMAWDHAQPEDSKRLEASHLLDASRRAGVCGDFFFQKRPKTTGNDNDDDVLSLGPDGVEAAALSGLSLAEELAPLLLKCDQEE